MWIVNSLASVPNLSQVVKYSEVRVSNPQGLCLYLDWCKLKLQEINKEIKIKDEERKKRRSDVIHKDKRKKLVTR